MQKKKSQYNKNKKIYILDTGVFINNLSYLFNDKIILTTPFIEEEIKSLKAKLDFYRATHTNLEIKLPKKDYMERIKKILKETKHNMSIADISLVALALEFKEKNKDVCLVSDDCSIQDVASTLNINTISLLRPKTTKKYKWKRICIACNKETESEICEICGSKTLYVRVK